MSEELFGLRWSELAPCELGGEGAVLERSSYGEVEEFVAAHREELLAPEVCSSAFARLPEASRKARYCEYALDSFRVRRASSTVGVFLGQATDWSTYYLRYLAVLPKFRGLGVAAGIVDRFGPFLRQSGFQRMEVDVSVSHRGQLRRMIEGGFLPMGILNTERWGSLVHLVCFLSEPHEDVFLGQFSAGLRSMPWPARTSASVPTSQPGERS